MTGVSSWTGGLVDDSITGSQFGDVLLGGDANDNIYGLDGPDFIDGHDDWNVIEGGNGDDVLYHSGFVDTLRGGTGDDIYVVNPRNGTSHVVLYDGSTDGTDTLDFSTTIDPSGVDVTLAHVSQMYSPSRWIYKSGKY